MQNLKATVKQFLDHNHADGNRLLLACSGGVDSMVLLYILVSLGYKPHVAHCNFQLRGADAHADEDFVEQYCKALGLTVHVKRFNTKEYAAEQGISIQMAARDLRYTFFKDLLNKHTLQAVATAHHAGDSLETILINLGRGTGFTGIAGIRSKTETAVRPLLSFTKKEILEYAKAHGLNWREDASNQKEDYQRNFIRLQVLPKLGEAFPNFEVSSKKSLHYLEEDRELFKSLVQSKLQLLVKKQAESEKLHISKLIKTGSAKALLRHWLLPKGAFDIEAIYNSLNRDSGAFFQTENHRLLKDREFLILKPNGGNSSEEEYFIEESASNITQPIYMEMEQINAAGFELNRSSGMVALDFDKLQFPLKLRHWKKGDKFVPLGMKGAKKVSDYFVDRKFSRFKKEETWLLCSGHNIVWIVNERINEHYKVSDTTKTVYFVRLF